MKSFLRVFGAVVLLHSLVGSLFAQSIEERFRELQRQMERVNEELEGVDGQEAVDILRGLQGLRPQQNEPAEAAGTGVPRDGATSNDSAASSRGAVVAPQPTLPIGPAEEPPGVEFLTRAVAPLQDSTGDLLLWQYGSARELRFVRQVFEGRYGPGDYRGDRWGPFETVYEYVMTSHEVCGTNTPNSTVPVEYEVRTPREDIFGNQIGGYDTETYVLDVDLRIRPNLAPAFDVEANRANNLSVLWTKYPIARLMPDVWSCNGPEIRQFNENLARLMESRPSLQSERDSRLGVPLRVHDKCGDLMNKPDLDSTGYQISSCTCLENILAGSLEDEDADALSWHLDATQLTLAAMHLNRTEMLAQCITRSDEPSDIPVARWNPRPFPYGEECRVAYEAVTDEYLADPCAVTPDSVERAAREYNRVLGDGSLCRTGSPLSRIPDVTTDQLQMRLAPQCAARQSGRQSDYAAAIEHIVRDLSQSDRPSDGCFDFSSQEFRRGMEERRYPQNGVPIAADFRPLSERAIGNENAAKAANAHRCVALFVLDQMIE